MKSRVVKLESELSLSELLLCVVVLLLVPVETAVLIDVLVDVDVDTGFNKPSMKLIVYEGCIKKHDYKTVIKRLPVVLLLPQSKR